MSEDGTLTCDECGLPLIACDCSPEHPVEGDLVTEDYLSFYVLGESKVAERFRVDPADWRAGVLTWMFLSRKFGNVWYVADDKPVLLDLGEHDHA